MTDEGHDRSCLDSRGRRRHSRGREVKDIWLFGGGVLFRSFLDAGMVDTVETAVIPVLLGDGIPIIPPGNRVALKLTKHVLYEKTGTMLLEYAID